MKNILAFIFALLILNLSCRTNNSSNTSRLNINPNSAASQVKIFTAANLTEYVQRNSTELDKMLVGNRIMVSGVVTKVEADFIELEGINYGKIKCSGTVFYQDEWKKLNGYFSDFNTTRAKRPLATVSGIYKSSDSPSVFLEECKVETVTK